MRRLPILRSIKAAYNNMTLSSWLEMKLQSLQLIMGLKGTWNSFGETALFSKGAGHPGQARVLDFFVPIRSVGFAVIGLAFYLLWRDVSHHSVWLKSRLRQHSSGLVA
jgi:hypothetical protein